MNRFIELSRLATRINRKGEKLNYPRILRFYRKNVDRIISSYSGNLFFWWDDVCHQPFEWLSFSVIQRNSSIPNAPCMNRWSHNPKIYWKIRYFKTELHSLLVAIIFATIKALNSSVILTMVSCKSDVFISNYFEMVFWSTTLTQQLDLR